MKIYSFDEVKDKFIGLPGTPERDTYEAKLKAELKKLNSKNSTPGNRQLPTDN